MQFHYDLIHNLYLVTTTKKRKTKNKKSIFNPKRKEIKIKSERNIENRTVELKGQILEPNRNGVVP